jgi:hypothetical protein
VLESFTIDVFAGRVGERFLVPIARDDEGALYEAVFT